MKLWEFELGADAAKETWKWPMPQSIVGHCDTPAAHTACNSAGLK